MREGDRFPGDEQLLENLLKASVDSMRYFSSSKDLHLPAQFRLAFRELGLAIGLEAIGSLEKQLDRDHCSRKISSYVDELAEFGPVSQEIMSFWLDPEHQRSRTWKEHIDINEVMLATSLVPDGVLYN